MRNVDIIIPVYNAYEYTEDCIKSIIRNTNLESNRLLLINDKSPDEKILPMLKKYETKNIIVLDNEENQGFVKTVNRGMKYSEENDVILLNSDTEVTPGWLEKMRACAYSDRYIATVTPFTNNGTLCSIPKFGEDNELPKNITLDEYSEIVEKSSKKEYPQISTANGFCMYIKRSVLNEFGFFDDITYEKGYGEENDFSYRIMNYGYTNNLCDDTFIYHKGSQSFTKENLTVTRAQVIEDHMERLRSKYPTYVERTDDFMRTNPLKSIQDRINLNVLLYNKKRILYLINEWDLDLNMTGGTSLHLRDLIDGIKEDTACLVLSPDKADKNICNLYLYVEEKRLKLYSFKTNLNNYNQISFTNKSYKNILENIFNIYEFDTVHIHHFLYQTFDIIEIAKKYNSKIILTLHDLYMICPTINMVKDGKYCGGMEPEKCKNCFKEKYLIQEVPINKWQDECRNVFENCNQIIVPSNNTKKLYSEIYNNINFEVIEHGVKLQKLEESIKKDSNYFNIAFVGVMAEHKGVNILKSLIKKAEGTNIKINLIGNSDSYPELANNKSNFVNHGKYNFGELPKKLKEKNIDLVCIFSVSPETYSYTLTESYMAEVPVITYNLGACRRKSSKR